MVGCQRTDRDRRRFDSAARGALSRLDTSDSEANRSSNDLRFVFHGLETPIPSIVKYYTELMIDHIGQTPDAPSPLGIASTRPVPAAISGW